MNKRLSEFERFRLMGDDLVRFRVEYDFITETGDLSRTPAITQLISSFKKVEGVYFWTAAVNDSEYKVYAGQTNSLGDVSGNTGARSSRISSERPLPMQSSCRMQFAEGLPIVCSRAAPAR